MQADIASNTIARISGLIFTPAPDQFLAGLGGFAAFYTHHQPEGDHHKYRRDDHDDVVVIVRELNSPAVDVGSDDGGKRGE